jgi:hypothetical protein
VTIYVVLRLYTPPPTKLEEGKRVPESVLALQSGAVLWQELDRYEAHSGSQAIRLCVASIGGDEGTYVAAPLGSWRPEPVRVKTTTVVTVGGS